MEEDRIEKAVIKGKEYALGDDIFDGKMVCDNESHVIISEYDIKALKDGRFHFLSQKAEVINLADYIGDGKILPTLNAIFVYNSADEEGQQIYTFAHHRSIITFDEGSQKLTYVFCVVDIVGGGGSQSNELFVEFDDQLRYNGLYPSDDAPDEVLRAFGRNTADKYTDGLMSSDDKFRLDDVVTKVANNTTSIQALARSKQDALVSGTNIKTVNGKSIVGSGDVSINIPNGNFYINDGNLYFLKGGTNAILVMEYDSTNRLMHFGYGTKDVPMRLWSDGVQLLNKNGVASAPLQCGTITSPTITALEERLKAVEDKLK